MYFSVFFLLLIGSVWSIPHHTADHANHCHIEDADSKLHHIEVGEKLSLPGKCQIVTCEKDFTISALTCAAVAVPAGCTETEIDYKKSYPDCCPQIVCKEKN
ncbi:hypothetical protein ILUMI_24786 [Ignelater luminosus]|uniref:Single domain-containing protein n=1 Tax=Ignelater luminosus TaxID=2038154 RepID=A0A8K0CB81_IGNLU|nr:hypothetical protein ILUMI_24786 [Ignelater luminosus]